MARRLRPADLLNPEPSVPLRLGRCQMLPAWGRATRVRGGRLCSDSPAQSLLARPPHEKPREDRREACLRGQPRNKGLARGKLTPTLQRDPSTFLCVEVPSLSSPSPRRTVVDAPRTESGWRPQSPTPELGELGLPLRGGTLAEPPDSPRGVGEDPW